MKKHRPRRWHSRHTGVTLIELLISITIGLLLSAIAAYVYQSVQSSARNLEAQALRNEASTIVFDFLGRDLRLAGYFPAQFQSIDSADFRGAFTNIVNPALPAFDQGIFGCSNATFNSATGLCNAAVPGQPDTVVINYFTDDTFTNPWEGLRRDCLGQAIENAQFAGVAYNVARSGVASPGPMTTVAQPLLVQNVYSLSGLETATFYANQAVPTRSLRCQGNNTPAGGNAPSPAQPIVQGIEQLVIRYGVANPALSSTPEQFFTAQEVSAIPIGIFGKTKTGDDISLNGWKRVSTVEVCIVTKTLDASARQPASTGNYIDCNNVNVVPNDRAIYKRQVRRFGVRNNLNTSYVY